MNKCLLTVFLFIILFSSLLSAASDDSVYKNAIIKYENYQATAELTLTGNRGSGGNFQVEMNGVYIFADRFLSWCLQYEDLANTDHADKYWILPQKATISYKGEIEKNYKHETSASMSNVASKMIWSFADNISIPEPQIYLPSDTEEEIEITNWYKDVKELFKDKGIYAQFYIEDRTPVGGSTTVYANFNIHIKDELTFHDVVNGWSLKGKKVGDGEYREYREPVSESRTGTLDLVVNCSAANKFQEKDFIGIYGIVGKELVMNISDFSIKDLSFSKSGSERFDSIFYKPHSRHKPSECTYSGDTQFTIKWRYDLGVKMDYEAVLEPVDSDWLP